MEWWSIGVMGKPTCLAVARIFAGKITDCYAKFHESSRKFAQIRPVNPRCLASQARHKLDAPSGLFAYAKRGRIVTDKANFL
jgi:hypothetical protein